MSRKKDGFVIKDKPKRILLQAMVDKELFERVRAKKNDIGHTWEQIVEAGLMAYSKRRFKK